jgi:hypothetical protein
MRPILRATAARPSFSHQDAAQPNLSAKGSADLFVLPYGDSKLLSRGACLLPMPRFDVNGMSVPWAMAP